MNGGYSIMIYFDQAASSFPKPVEVTDAMVHVMNTTAANPGRGGHKLAREAANIVADTRERAAQIFGCSNPNHVIFFSNATVALNQAIKGIDWDEGDQVITTSIEHNSMRRPLEYINNRYGVDVVYVKWNDDEEQFVTDIEKKITSRTKMLAITHASNVTGSVIPLYRLLRIAKRRDILTVVDASQTAGHLPIDMQKQGIDMLAFPGHKGLLGPQGTGLLLIEGDIDVHPIHHGGTGSFSELKHQPEHWPERLESGTLNTPGIAGLNAALKVYEQRESDNVSRETFLTNKLLSRLNTIDGVTCYGPGESKQRLPIVAFNIAHVPSQEVAMILDSHYHIAVRAGLHCNPLAHETLHTIEQGVIRASLSRYNTEEEVITFIHAIEEIAQAYRGL